MDTCKLGYFGKLALAQVDLEVVADILVLVAKLLFDLVHFGLVLTHRLHPDLRILGKHVGGEDFG